MPGNIYQEFQKILAANLVAGKKTAWLAPFNREVLNRPPASVGTLPQPPAAAVAPFRTRATPAPVAPPPVAPRPLAVSAPPPAPVVRATAAAPPLTFPNGVQGDPVVAWEELVQACQSCQRCGLSTTRHSVVCEDGYRQARVMFIGEGPGADEDRQGIPFVGRAGQMLTNMIKAMGLDRTLADSMRGVYIANIVKCRPPGNRNPELSEVEACLPYLARQIELVRPQVIVLLGAVALRCLLGGSSITKERGLWKDYRGIPVMPTFHPAYLLRFEHQPDQFKSEKMKVWQDLQQVMQRLGLPGKQ